MSTSDPVWQFIQPQASSLGGHCIASLDSHVMVSALKVPRCMHFRTLGQIH